MSQTVTGHLEADERRVRAAWERFVGGDDDVQGVPAQILLSWYRFTWSN